MQLHEQLHNFTSQAANTLPNSLKTHSHRVKSMVKLPKHGSLPPLVKLLMELFFLKTALRVKLSCDKRAQTSTLLVTDDGTTEDE
jgi:type VI protein secretion system component VasF